MGDDVDDYLFADGTFGCTATRDITISCTWDADGGMAQGRNALPNAFDGDGTDSNLGALPQVLGEVRICVS